MDGHLLHETCNKCKTYWDVMFQAFKSEVVADDEKKLLTVDTYIRFLDEIGKYIPIVPGDSSQSSSKTSNFCIIL